MKKLVIKTLQIFYALACLLSLQNCENITIAENLSNELESYEIKILPYNPDNDDNILIIEKICSSDVNCSLVIEGKQIQYKRYINTMLGMPCIEELDSTFIGQLASGQYVLIHSVIDKNSFVPDSIFLIDTISFKVK